MVFRLFVERKPGFALEAEALPGEMGVPAVTRARVFNRYDVEHIDPALMEKARETVFSEPATDTRLDALPEEDCFVLAVESLPGQYDQRADAAEQCLQLLSLGSHCTNRMGTPWRRSTWPFPLKNARNTPSGTVFLRFSRRKIHALHRQIVHPDLFSGSLGEKPVVRTARIYYLYGNLSEADRQQIRRHLINPVECREARLAPYETLSRQEPAPKPMEILTDFCEQTPDGLCARYGLAMDQADAAFVQEHFRREGRAPTMTELRVLDTYWSDHCRHTTFLTRLERVTFDDPEAQSAFDDYLHLRETLGDQKPVTLMDLATIGAKALKAEGKLTDLDESKEINACTVRICVDVDGEPQPWLLLFKNETHNHPTEIEPFGGAATCLGGAIRDPLSGRAYVYQAMRVSGSADPRPGGAPALPGKLPQRRIVLGSAAGYSSYGNQIGLATGLVEEVYHPGYQAKHMEIGALVGAVPEKNVRREEPVPGDVVLLIGGRTGRDGCGGATGSSKAHGESSLALCGSEVQKGNAPEERKLQRLFRNRDAALLIKRCNDFGAGGVSVAIGELAEGLAIELDQVPRKYFGLDGTELAISESQERMAVVVAPGDAEAMICLAKEENLLAVPVATVTKEPRLVMRWQGKAIVDLPRSFIDSNGAPRAAAAHVAAPAPDPEKPKDFYALAADLNVCLKRGLSERFDSTVGANTVLMPFGGKYQLTPIQAMAARIPVERGETNACSFMAYAFDPYASEASPFRGAYLAVAESVCRAVAGGAEPGSLHLSFQEYFPKPGSDPARWGLPLAALLGALRAQLALGVAAVGGKDSMSGTFEHLDVPPTLVSFAVGMGDVGQACSPEFKQAGSEVVLLRPGYGPDGLPSGATLKPLLARVHALIASGRARAVWTVGAGGIAEGVMKMCLGNRIGFRFTKKQDLFAPCRCGFLLELAEGTEGEPLGRTQETPEIVCGDKTYSIENLQRALEQPLEDVYPLRPRQTPETVLPVLTGQEPSLFHAKNRAAAPRVLIPVFPGTNCEYESARAVEAAGLEARVMVLNTMNAQGIRESAGRFCTMLSQSHILFLPGGFSAGDEPDGSGRFITAFLRNPEISDRISELLSLRDGLILGVCNGFQALIKLGLAPYGRIMPPSEHAPTLTYNTIGRHQSRLVQIRVVSAASPWMMNTRPGEIYTAPVSHGEGRFVCPPEELSRLAAAGQILTQYADGQGRPTMDPFWNPNGSDLAVEGLLSPDGRVLGKMGHAERIGSGLYQNVPGRTDMGLFRSAAAYFA